MAKNHVFVGLYGSGKTEIAINYAINLKQNYSQVAIADVDVVSPYFRIRDVRELIQSYDIKTITPPENILNADLPLITASVMGYLGNPEYQVVLDVGGAERGVVVLGYLREYLGDSMVYFVVNTKRPFTESSEQIVQVVRRIEERSGIKVDYLVNNTNLGSETTVDLIEDSEIVISKASEILNIPIAFTVTAQTDTLISKFNIFRIKRFLKKREELS